MRLRGLERFLSMTCCENLVAAGSVGNVSSFYSVGERCYRVGKTGIGLADRSRECAFSRARTAEREVDSTVNVASEIARMVGGSNERIPLSSRYGDEVSHSVDRVSRL